MLGTVVTEHAQRVRSEAYPLGWGLIGQGAVMGEENESGGQEPSQDVSPAVEADPPSDPPPRVRPIATGPEFKALTQNELERLAKRGDQPKRRSRTGEPKGGSSGGGDSGKE